MITSTCVENICHIVGHSTTFYFPVIVPDGFLYWVRVNGETMVVEEKNHIQLRTHYAEGVYIVDVVTKGYFSTFFNMVEQDHEEFVRCVNAVKFPKKQVLVMTTKAKTDLQEARKRKEEGIDYLRVGPKS